MSQESKKNKIDFQESELYRKEELSENDDDRNLQNFYFEDENQDDFNSVKTDIKMQQGLQQFMSEQIKQTTDYEKQIEQKSIFSMYPAEQIKKILLNNFPEVQNEIKVMADFQLLEIYEQLVNCKQLKNRPEASFSSMISTIISCFPNMRDTIVNYDEDQIRKLYYNALKHQPLRVKQNYHTTLRNSSNQNFENIGNTTIGSPANKSIFQMKTQILQKAPNFKHQINKLTDQQIQLVYNSSKRQTSLNQKQSYKPVQKKKYAIQNKLIFDKRSQNLSLINNNSSAGLNIQSIPIINNNKKVAANSVNQFSENIGNQMIKPSSLISVQPFGVKTSPKGIQNIRYYELNCHEKDLSQSFAFVYQKYQQRCFEQQSKKTNSNFQFPNCTCNCCQNNMVMKVLKQMSQLMAHKF